MMDSKELFYEVDTRKHQQLVAERLLAVAKRFIARSINHDQSKFSENEKPYYLDPVWELNQPDAPKYGTPEHKALTDKMGAGWEHHATVNDHHIEFFIPYSVQTLNDPIRAMDLFALFEMLCDWIAASMRKGNSWALALEQLAKKYPIDHQLECILRNTAPMIERTVGELKKDING